MTRKPSVVTIAGFGDHGIDSDKCREILPGVNIILFDEFIDQGAARNLAIEHTQTEWIMYIDIDDVLLPAAIEALEEHQDADVISVAYLYNGMVYNPALPSKEFVLGPDFYCKATQDFLLNASPFRKSVWERIKYHGEHPNALFWVDLMLAGVKFGKTSVCCVEYRSRKESHSSTISFEGRAKLARDIRNYRKDERRDELCK